MYTARGQLVDQTQESAAMDSALGWLDTDGEQRKRMLEVVDLFKEEGTVDELGIGSIRDALSDSLFPGTSVLHTRLRYVLFIPWLMQLAARKPTPAQMSAEFRDLEYRLISGLLAGGEGLGVIGRRAGRRLKQLPSSMYWSALGEWRIRTGDFSPDGYFRRQHDYRRLSDRTVKADDPEARELLPSTGFDPHLPQPATHEWLTSVNFTLAAEEERYLSDVIATSTKGSMLSWLIHNQPGNTAVYVWEIDNLDRAPEHLRTLVDHARRFHTAIHGAALIYNLLLARKAARDDAAARYEERLDEWWKELNATAALNGWSRTEWWDTIRRQNPRLRPITMQFVDHWLDLIENDIDPKKSKKAHELIGSRERRIKGRRARLDNPPALDRWTGSSGLGRHDFRWTVSRQHLEDLYTARDSS